MNGQRVGVLGAGRMGLPIIGHLVRAGFEVVVYDPDPAKKEPVASSGASSAPGTSDVARRCGTILACVGYEEQLDEIMLGPGGMLGQLQAGALVAVLSTVSPAGMRRLEQAAQAGGVDVVDAPVCRGRLAADAGELLSLLGGTEAATTRFTAVARAYSADVVRLGDIGSGQVGKAVNNLILWACLVADHEGLALAQRFGVDIAELRSALQMSSAANHALGNWGNQTMAWAEDDMKIVSDMAAEAGISLPQTALNREISRALKPRRYQVDKYGH
ncbi:MAG TPA: NAD(P)-dependent oxidoreductase [Trebonia sp.]|nr:NAD(P)-dependent oxidoreductase [Trebonia sp.]